VLNSALFKHDVLLLIFQSAVFYSIRLKHICTAISVKSCWHQLQLLNDSWKTRTASRLMFRDWKCMTASRRGRTLQTVSGGIKEFTIFWHSSFWPTEKSEVIQIITASVSISVHPKAVRLTPHLQPERDLCSELCAHHLVAPLFSSSALWTLLLLLLLLLLPRLHCCAAV